MIQIINYEIIFLSIKFSGIKLEIIGFNNLSKKKLKLVFTDLSID